MRENFVAIPNMAVQGNDSLFKALDRDNLIYVMWAVQKSPNIQSNYYFSINLLLQLTGQSANKYTIELIKDTLLILESNELMMNFDNNTKIKTANKNTILCYSINWFEENDSHEECNWFKLYDDAVIEIFKEIKANRGSNHFVLTTYCNLISRMRIGISGLEEYCYPSHSKIMQDTNFSKSQIEGYIKNLYEIDLIRYNNSGDYVKDGKYITGNNFYCKCIHGWENLLEVVCTENIKTMEKKGWERRNQDSSNKKRINTIDTKIAEINMP